MHKISKIFLMFFSLLVILNGSLVSVFAVEPEDPNEALERIIEQKKLEIERENERNHYEVNKKSTPVFIIPGDKIYGPFKSGSTQILSITVQNASSFGAHQIKAQLVPQATKDDAFGLLLPYGCSLNASKYSLAGGGKHTFEFVLNINPKAVPKPHKVSIKLNYRNAVGVGFEESIDIYLKINNKFELPSVSVSDYNVLGGSVNSDIARKLDIRLKNNSSEAVKNLSIQLTGLSADGIELTEDTDYKYLGDLGEKKEIRSSYNIKASPAATGSKALVLKINYFDKEGNSYQKDWPLSITIGNSILRSNEVVGKFSSNYYQIDAGGRGNISFSLQNLSGTTLKDVEVEFSSDSDIVQLLNYDPVVTDLENGRIKNFNLEVFVKNSAQKGVVPIYARIVNKNAEKSKQTIAISSIRIDNDKDENSKSRPKIIINHFSYGGDGYVLAGKEFNLFVSFYNPNPGTRLKSIKAQMESEDGVFIPVSGTNSFFFDSIAPFKEKTSIIRLKTKGDAKVKLYTVTFTIEYEDGEGRGYDEKGNIFSTKEAVTVNVKQELRLNVPEIGSLFGNIGVPTEIETNFQNLGKSPLYNLIVKLEGDDFDKEDGTSFIGNLEPGNEDSFSGKIIPKKEGKLKGNIVFEYEDEAGEKYTHKQPFVIEVEKGGGPAPEDRGMLPPSDLADAGEDQDKVGGGSGGSSGLIGLILLVLIVAAIVFAVIVIKRAKKRKLQKFLEEEDDDETE